MTMSTGDFPMSSISSFDFLSLFLVKFDRWFPASNDNFYASTLMIEPCSWPANAKRMTKFKRERAREKSIANIIMFEEYSKLRFILVSNQI